MYKFLDRELYLWQGVLVFVIFFILMIYSGIYLNKTFFNYDFDPLSKIDRKMVELQNKENKTAEDFNELGLVYFQKGTLTEAKQAFIRAIALKNGYADANYNLGLVYLEEENLDNAEKYFLKTLSFDSSRDIAKFDLAKVYIETGKYKDAENMLDEAKSTFSTTADYFYYMGIVLKNTDREKEAISNFEMALKFDPQYREVLDELNNIQKEK